MESNDCLQLRCGIKGLFKIIQDILDMFGSDRKPDRIGEDALIALLFLAQLRMRGRCGMDHQTFYIGHIGQQGKQLQMIDEAVCFFDPAADVECEDRCAAMRKIPLIKRMIRMIRQRWMADAFHHRMGIQIADDRGRILRMTL